MLPVQLYVLGTPRLEREGTAVYIDTQKGIALLAYLAITETCSRSELLALLWPEFSTPQAQNALRRTLSSLRKAIGRERLETDRFTVRLVSSIEDDQPGPQGVWTDVSTFRALLAENTPDALSAAMDLYRAEFLAGFCLRDSIPFDEWQAAQARLLRQEAAIACEALTSIYIQQQEWMAAIQYGQQWLDFDPLHEEAHRQMMCSYAQSGNRAAALRQYETCVHLLSQELDIEPDSETTHLYLCIRDGREYSAKVSYAVTMPSSPGRSLAEHKSISPDIPVFNNHQKSILAIEEAGSDTDRRQSENKFFTHNLPSLLSQFFGRETEIREIISRLRTPRCRLLTIFGAGGIGKTRLAIEVGEKLLSVYQDGIFFVPLASLHEGENIVTTLADALNFQFYGQEDGRAQLLNFLREKEMLLILDNFEHLLDNAEFVLDILQTAAKVKIIVTSRVSLNDQAEWLYEIAGLPFPKTDVDLEQFNEFAALQLFQDRVHRANYKTPLIERDYPFVNRICQMVDGLPLAIELAASWTHILSCEEIYQELADNLGAISMHGKSAPERHQNLYVLCEYSWKLLTESEQRVFKNLAVFHGGFTHKAAKEVAGADLSVLSKLIDASLVQNSIARRFQLHPVLKEFAFQKLMTHQDEATKVQCQHAVFYLTFLQQQAAQLRSGDQFVSAIQAIAVEYENVSQACIWVVARGDGKLIENGLESLYQFFTVRSRFEEGVALFAKAVQQLPPQQESEEIETSLFVIKQKILARQGALAARLRNWEQAEALLENSLEIFRTYGEQQEIVFCLIHLSSMKMWQRQPRQAQPLLEEALPLAKLTKSEYLEMDVLRLLGAVQHEEHNYQKGYTYFEQALAGYRHLGDLIGQAYALNNLGACKLGLGEVGLARIYYEQARQIHFRLGNKWGEGFVLNNLGVLALVCGDPEGALAFIEQALQLYCQVGSQLDAYIACSNLGRVYRYLGQYEYAFSCYEQAMMYIQKREDLQNAKAGILSNFALICQLQGKKDHALVYFQQAQQTSFSLTTYDLNYGWRQGYIFTENHRLVEAKEIYEQFARYVSCHWPKRMSEHGSVEINAGLARVNLLMNNLPTAMQQVEEILPFLDASENYWGEDNQMFVHLTCYQVLKANHDSRARDVLCAAYALLQERAVKINNSEWQRTFLENVPDNREILREYARAESAGDI